MIRFAMRSWATKEALDDIPSYENYIKNRISKTILRFLKKYIDEELKPEILDADFDEKRMIQNYVGGAALLTLTEMEAVERTVLAVKRGHGIIDSAKELAEIVERNS